jgi:hypothetical protein
LLSAPRTLVVVVVLTSALPALAQKSGGITITEPGIYELAGLFKKADTVALVRVIAGDAESYDIAVYKARVIKTFKGQTTGETIYFGPYLGERLGWEYVLFLRTAPEPITTKSTAGYGTIHYSEVFDQGYTAMMTSYECVFDGADMTQRCDYGVRVCTDYIKLPKSMPVFPPLTENVPFGCRWVRKTALLEELGALQKAANQTVGQKTQ